MRAGQKPMGVLEVLSAAIDGECMDVEALLMEVRSSVQALADATRLARVWVHSVAADGFSLDQDSARQDLAIIDAALARFGEEPQ